MACRKASRHDAKAQRLQALPVSLPIPNTAARDPLFRLLSFLSATPPFPSPDAKQLCRKERKRRKGCRCKPAAAVGFGKDQDLNPPRLQWPRTSSADHTENMQGVFMRLSEVPNDGVGADLSATNPANFPSRRPPGSGPDRIHRIAQFLLGNRPGIRRKPRRALRPIFVSFESFVVQANAGTFKLRMTRIFTNGLEKHPAVCVADLHSGRGGVCRFHADPPRMSPSCIRAENMLKSILQYWRIWSSKN